MIEGFVNYVSISGFAKLTSEKNYIQSSELRRRVKTTNVKCEAIPDRSVVSPELNVTTFV